MDINNVQGYNPKKQNNFELTEIYLPEPKGLAYKYEGKNRLKINPTAKITKY